VKIVASVENSNSEILYIEPELLGFTKFEDRASWGSFMIDLPVEGGEINQYISLADFKVPEWWNSNHKLTDQIIPTPDFSKVIEIIIQNSSATSKDKEVKVVLKEFKFVKDISDKVEVVMIVFILLLTYLTILKFKKKPEDGTEKGKIIISYDPVEIEDAGSKELDRIVEYISSNYSDADLSVEQLSKGAGVSTSKIPSLLKKHFSMNFKQYLNKVRITESKRLLLETDHQVVTIAHSVGYNNIPHFNRTFKQITGLSPKQFREHPEDAADMLKDINMDKE
jgi:AraC-like DNA-binding protein